MKRVIRPENTVNGVLANSDTLVVSMAQLVNAMNNLPSGHDICVYCGAQKPHGHSLQCPFAKEGS